MTSDRAVANEPEAAGMELVGIVGLSAPVWGGGAYINSSREVVVFPWTNIPPKPEAMLFKPLALGTRLYAVERAIGEGR